MSTLYVVSTPIGNLEDITLRALRVLGEVTLIAAEDTRVTGRLLARHGIATPTVSYHHHNRRRRLPTLLAALEKGDVALVCDAGTPGVNDPGWELVSAARRAGHAVAAVPGPSTVTAAVAVAGLPVDGFLYLGFLPRRRSHRRRLLAQALALPWALVALETPHRLREALEDLAELAAHRPLAVCRELTKVHEEVFQGTALQALDHFAAPRGEFTLVVQGAPEGSAAPDEDRARQLARRLRQQGLRSREAVDRISAETGVTRRRAYTLWLESKGDGPGVAGDLC